MRKPLPYHIDLTKEDVKAIQFSGNRYGWSNVLFGMLEADESESYRADGFPIRIGRYKMSESEAWELLDAVRDDTEDWTISFPLLSDDSNLASELDRLFNEVI